MLKKLSYQDFDIRFEHAAGGDEWRVTGESHEGSAAGMFRPPAGNGDVQAILTGAPWTGGDAVRRYGTELFNALFTADLRALFMTSFRSAKSGGRGLRVRLRAEGAPLSDVPWELLWRSDIDVPLAASEWHPIVRFIQLPFPGNPLAVDGRLRILLVSALPSDQDRLDVDREADAIVRTMSTLADHVEIVRLADAGKLDLFHAGEGGFHAVHFMLHGQVDPRAEGQLLLRGADGRSEPLTASDLRRLAHDWALGGTRLVVLNACDTGRDRNGHDFTGLASAVVQSGIPAVVSMRYPITDDAAAYFSNELYRGLAQGCPVDQAVTQARKLVQLMIKDAEEWITPALHMRATDGVLFQTRTTPVVPRVDLQGDIQAQTALRSEAHSGPVPASRPSQDLVIEVGTNTVRVSSPLGSAEAPLGDTGALAAAYRNLLRYDGTSDGTPEILKSLGGELFAAVFQEDVEALVNKTLASVPRDLRLRLRIADPERIPLPWEALYHPRRKTFLALAGSTRPLRMELADVESVRPDPVERPLRLLFVACRPLDMPPLELEREWNWFQSTMKESGDTIVADVLMDPTPAEWLAKLSATEYHIVHFAGYDTHAFTEFRKDEGIILLGENGERRDVVCDDLVQLLQGFPSIRLAVFNTCFTMHSLGPALIRCGIPSVIGARGFVMDAVAVRFTSLFYPLLVRERGRIDVALAEARRMLYLYPAEYAPAPWHGHGLYTAIGGDDFFGESA